MMCHRICMQSGITPVHICAQYGYTTLLELLCDKYGASPTTAKYVSTNL